MILDRPPPRIAKKAVSIMNMNSKRKAIFNSTHVNVFKFIDSSAIYQLTAARGAEPAAQRSFDTAGGM